MQIKDIKPQNRQPVILFADDDEICLNVSVQILQKLGYTVLEARDGKEAIEVYEDNQDRVDLVILDMVMPHNGGHTFEKIEIGENLTAFALLHHLSITHKSKPMLGFLLEDFNVYHDYLFDEFSHPCIVSDHFLYFGQLVSTHVNDPCFLLAIFIG